MIKLEDEALHKYVFLYGNIVKSGANEILERCCFLLMLDVEAGSILLAIYISPSDTLIRFCDKMAKMLENVFKIFIQIGSFIPRILT